MSPEQKQRYSKHLLFVWVSLYEPVKSSCMRTFHKEDTRYTAKPLPTVVHK